MAPKNGMLKFGEKRGMTEREKGKDGRNRQRSRNKGMEENARNEKG